MATASSRLNSARSLGYYQHPTPNWLAAISFGNNANHCVAIPSFHPTITPQTLRFGVSQPTILPRGQRITIVARYRWSITLSPYPLHTSKNAHLITLLFERQSRHPNRTLCNRGSNWRSEGHAEGINMS